VSTFIENLHALMTQQQADKKMRRLVSRIVSAKMKTDGRVSMEWVKAELLRRGHAEEIARKAVEEYEAAAWRRQLMPRGFRK
jgi:hypothetical protein